MKHHDKLIRLSIFVGVLCAHVVLLTLLWQSSSKHVELELELIEFVDLEQLDLMQQEPSILPSDGAISSELVSKSISTAPSTDVRLPSDTAKMQPKKDVKISSKILDKPKVNQIDNNQNPSKAPRSQNNKADMTTKEKPFSQPVNRDLVNKDAVPSSDVVKNEKLPHAETKSTVYDNQKIVSTPAKDINVGELSGTQSDKSKQINQASRQDTSHTKKQGQHDEIKKSGTDTTKDARQGNDKGVSATNPVRATATLPRPPYPPLSETNEEEGIVMLKVLVSPSGKVEKVSISKSSGFSRLDNAAKNAALKGSFKTNVWTEYDISVEFSL